SNRLRFLMQHPRHLAAYVSHRYSALCTGVFLARREIMPVLRDAARRYARFHARFRLPDQDLLSVCVADLGLDCAPLPFSANAATLHALPDASHAEKGRNGKYAWVSRHVETMLADGRLTIRHPGRGDETVEQSIAVLHYAGADKPWRASATLRRGFREIWP